MKESMKGTSHQVRLVVTILAFALAPQFSRAHVTLQTNQPLRPKGLATVILNVPNERFVDNNKVTLEVPEAFLKAGGRVSRVVYPTGWTVTLEKKDKPGEVYQKEKSERADRDAKREAGADHSARTPKAEEDQKEKQAMDEMRKKWITKVTFEGGTIPPDGFQQFQIGFQLPDGPGKYRFVAVQTYADGKDVAWSELVEGAEHPAATLNVSAPPLIAYNDLPVPLSLLALGLSLVAVIKRSKTVTKAKAGSNSLAGGGLQDAAEQAIR